MLGWETYEGCKRVGIPAIYATFDKFREYPPSIGNDLRRLPVYKDPVATKDELATCLISVVEEARMNGKYLIIDTKAGFRPHDPMFEAMMLAEVGNAESLTALVAVWSGVIKSRDPFDEMGITFNRTFYRFWGLRSELARIPSDEKTHRWIPRFLSATAVENIKVTSPGKSICFNLDLNTTQPSEPIGYINEVAEHLDDATQHIYRAILEPIIDRAPEVPAAEW